VWFQGAAPGLGRNEAAWTCRKITYARGLLVEQIQIESRKCFQGWNKKVRKKANLKSKISASSITLVKRDTLHRCMGSDSIRARGYHTAARSLTSHVLLVYYLRNLRRKTTTGLARNHDNSVNNKNVTKMGQYQTNGAGPPPQYLLAKHRQEAVSEKTDNHEKPDAHQTCSASPDAFSETGFACWKRQRKINPQKGW
jgi:hypothetical protein